ncbi:MAG: TIGR00269 family protein [Methanomassiliicoccales archaeon]
MSLSSLSVDCNLCNKTAVYTARYSGRSYCSRHFSEQVEKRIKKEVRAQHILDSGTIGVAVSGGKDSMTALHTLLTLAEGRKNCKIVALTVDEGIAGYRDVSLKLIKEYCEGRGVEWHVASYADYMGMTMDRLVTMKRPRTSCAYCGVMRRQLLNSLSIDCGASKLATGLNLDDTAQSVLMNISRADVDRLSMMGPHEKEIPGLIPRVQPLRLIPESEVLLYAILNKIPFMRSSCPHSEEASRNLFRDIVLRIEDAMPGARYAIISSAMQMRPQRNGAPANICPECGAVTSGQKCRACELRDEISGLTADAK